jgi:hypothetical protein
MLNLGITLNLCDLVCLMNNTLSSDKILQQMYRCMTEFVPNSNGKEQSSFITEGNDKKIGFVIDLNISRVLNTCISYTVYKNETNISDKLKYLIENHLINIDVDIFENKKLDSDTLVKKLMSIWKEDPINSFRTLLRKLDNDYEEFDNTTQKLLNNTFTRNIKDGKFTVDVILKDDEAEIQKLSSGKEIIKNGNSDKEEIQKEIQISFTKDVLPYIIPLTCILTIKNSNNDFIKMLIDIKNNKELLEIFDDQCLIWWNKKDLIELVKEIVNKYFDKKSNAYNISVQFKMSLQSLIDMPKELLELISECLKPKDIEKKEYGEVFTPMNLVSDMLDKLPEHVWKNKNLKWLDPCCGMGNFPIAVYLRLIDTLKYEIPNDAERKKHILQNMLYMSELNKKNIFICKQIFDMNNEYKLNIYEGDSLKADYLKEFGIKQFDIIVGNPPYNDNSGNKGKGHTLWTKFVELSLNKILNKNGYLVFIHPSLWRQIDHPCLKLIKDKRLIYLEIHNVDDGQKMFRCATRYDWYVLQNTLLTDFTSGNTLSTDFTSGNTLLTDFTSGNTLLTDFTSGNTLLTDFTSGNTNYKNQTIIKGEDGIINKINLNEWQFIPNMMFKEIKKLVINESENKIQIIHSESNYEVRRKWMSHTKTIKHIYPCVYSINKQNEISCKYSEITDKGHFNICKFIFTNGSGFYCDKDGKYGLTQWASGIADTEKNLLLIENAFKTLKFNNIKKAIQLDSSSYNIKVMKLFKKDFYNEFLNDELLIKK